MKNNALSDYRAILVAATAIAVLSLAGANAYAADVSQVVVTPFGQAVAAGLPTPVTTVAIPAVCTPLPNGDFPLSCEIGKRTKDVRAFIVAAAPPAVATDDAVVFARTGPESSSLHRRDPLAGDPAGGVKLSQASVAGRPSVSGDGTLSVVTGGNLDGCFHLTRNSKEAACLRLPQSISAVAVSPNANRFAYVVCGAAGANPPAFPGSCTTTKDKISVVDAVAKDVRTFSLLPVPVAGATTNAIDLVEGMTFTADGRFLIYDGRSQVQAGGPVEQRWAIYGLDLTTGKTFVLVPPNPDFHFRWPSLARTSDDYLVMDAYDTTTWTDHVLAVRLSTGVKSIVASDGPRCCIEVQPGVLLPADLPLYGMPSYTGNDSAVVFSATDVAEVYGGLPGGSPTRTSLQKKVLAMDRLTPVDGPWTRNAAVLQAPWLSDAAAGVVYRPGPWPRAADVDSDGSADTGDNCLAFPNGPGQPDAGGNSQRDTDGDGYGNSCDADLDGSGFVNYEDLALFRAAFGSNNPDADLDGSGFVNFADLARFRALFGKAPGPSALHPE